MQPSSSGMQAEDRMSVTTINASATQVSSLTLPQGIMQRFLYHLLTMGEQRFHVMGCSHGMAHLDTVKFICADFTVCILPLQVVWQGS